MLMTRNLYRLAKTAVCIGGLPLLPACTAEPAPERSVGAESGFFAAGEQGPGTAVPPEYLGDGSVDGDTGEDPPSDRVIDFRWWGQPNGYWCGPASTQMVLGTRMETPPSQQTLATFMGTTTNGTDHIGLPASALNKWLTPPNPYRARLIDGNPTQAQRDLLRKDILARVGSGWPIVANVVSGWRPPGYPTGQIYHYVAIMGYSDGGSRVLIADPAAEGSAGPRWSNVPRTYWVTIENLGTWIGGKGYAA